ncbi:hypothetical protein [uncultured Bacteroides sp.]|uniref:hypothetical protein n=1 Tax=uncultured Bacteroides sp. TaxID=162156 RepID=UPI0026084413|nr:hypothetical protein [uncultured Bacteroides sp.]
MIANMNFSFTRLMAVMKRDMMENWRTNMYRLIGVYTGAAMAFLFGMYGVLSGNRRETGEIQYESFCNTFHSILTFVIFFYLMICASRIMEVMNTKNKRISYMMLPATIGEKFISRVIYVCITSMVIFFVGLFFAELTRLALLPLFDAPEEFHRFCLFDIMSVSFYDTIHINPEVYGTSSTFISYLFLISNGLWGHSIYILGGTYFRKHPFIKTWGIMILLFVIIAYIFGRMVAKELFSYFDPTDVDLWNVNIISIVFLVLTVINWTLSYHLFRNSQITDRKLFT